jgi:hypothetical protein
MEGTYDVEPVAVPSAKDGEAPGLSPVAIRELARWYEEEGNRRRYGGELDQGALDRDLRQFLAERGVLPDFVSVEFERVMQAVFAVEGLSAQSADGRPRPMRS